MHWRFTLFLLMASSLPLSAQATASQLSLNGVRRIVVRFVMTEEDVAAGVDTARIRGVIDGKLRAPGITLLPGRTGGDGSLDVNIGALRNSGGANVTFFYFIAFRQPAKIPRLPDPPYPPVPSLTWNSSVSFGTEPAESIAAHLAGVTGELMDVFLSAWEAGQRSGK